jgi:hypothetical protein
MTCNREALQHELKTRGKTLPPEEVEAMKDEFNGLVDLVMEFPEDLRQRVNASQRVFGEYEEAKRAWGGGNCAWSSRSPRNTATAPVVPGHHPGGEHGPDAGRG